MAVNGNELTDKQDRFISSYIVCWNATQAAREAGYKATSGSLRVIGHENLTKPNIKAEIEKRLDQFTMGKNEILSRLTQQASSDIGDFAGIENSKDIANHPQSYLIKKFKKRRYIPRDKNEDTYEDIEIELYDAHAPLVDLGKARSLFTDKIEQSVKIDGKLVILPKQDD